MATNTAPRLALEVLEKIVENLDSGYASRSDLRSCLVVSRAFRHCALRRLYYHVNLSNARNNHLLDLQDLIFPPPGFPFAGVGRYIKSIAISYHYAYDSPYYPGQPVNTILVNQFLSSNLLMSLIGAINTQLREFTLCMKIGFPKSGQSFEWDQLSPIFRDALQPLIQSHLTSLTLLNLTSIPRALLLGTRLKHVAFTHCFEDSAASRFRRRNYPLLESLSTDHSHPLGRIGDSFDNLRKIRTFNSSFDDSVRAWAMMVNARSTLEEINIVQDCDLGGVLTSLTLDMIPNLEYLSYSHRHVPFPLNNPNFSTLLHLFNIPSPAMKLKSLDLYVRYANAGLAQSRTEAIIQVTDPRWALFDAMLTGGRFPGLHRVKILFIIDGAALWDNANMDARDIENDAKTALMPWFAGLATSPTITFTLETRAYIERFGEP